MGKSNHTTDFREQAIKLALSSDIPVSETAESLGITRALLYIANPEEFASFIMKVF
tara:strand:- start:208 stop:375 length:168 start_codon:yes stop_codon:yes gene_type:complete